MDKNAIKKYAVWARNELIARVTQKAEYYGITASQADGQTGELAHPDGRTFDEQSQRDASRAEITEKKTTPAEADSIGGRLLTNVEKKQRKALIQKIEDYTELLLPDYLLREGSVIEQMIALIPEEDWTDQVQIIGWLYQYYNTESKDKVFANLKKNIKITKENIPAAIMKEVLKAGLDINTNYLYWEFVN